MVDSGGSVDQLPLVPVPHYCGVHGFQSFDDLVQAVEVHHRIEIEVHVNDRFLGLLQEQGKIFAHFVTESLFTMDPTEVDGGGTDGTDISEGLVGVDQQQVGIFLDLEKVREAGAEVGSGDDVLLGNLVGVVVKSGTEK